jgi:hypothetical protein
MKNAHKILAGKFEGKRPFGRPRCKWEDNIRMYLRGIVWEGVDWIYLVEDRGQWQTLVDLVMNLWVP